MHTPGMIATGALLMLAASACGGSTSADPSSPTPITSTPSTTSATLSASSTPTIDPNSDAAILAAVQAYAAAFTKVGQEASLGALDGVVDPKCPCEETLSSLATQLGAKHEHVDALIVATGARILRRSSTNADVSVLISNHSYRVLSSKGVQVGTGQAGSTPTVLSLERRGSLWEVFYVDSPS
jgi:hypothetical protein